jgi:hypothetical protein
MIPQNVSSKRAQIINASSEDELETAFPPAHAQVRVPMERIHNLF